MTSSRFFIFKHYHLSHLPQLTYSPYFLSPFWLPSSFPLIPNSRSMFGGFFPLLNHPNLPCRFLWARGPRHRSAAARLLRYWVRFPARTWKFVCCECCVLSGTGLCDELITRPQEFYRLWCVVVRDLETSRTRRAWLTGGLSRRKQTKNIYISLLVDWCLLNSWNSFLCRP